MVRALDTPTAALSPPSSAAAKHRVGFVSVAPGEKLEVLDWGGSGPTLVLLAGLGGTAHQFDDFAPALTDMFHVYGVTRRGFGLSSVPVTGYDLPTLTDDIDHVLDALRAERAVLVGHSAAGEELTAYAVAHPTRVAALVYLDAAYDRTGRSAPGGASEDCSNVLPPEPADLDTPAHFAEWLSRSRGARLPDDEARILFEHHGPDEGFEQYGKSLRRPDYNRVAAPALALFAVAASPEDYFATWRSMDAAAQARARHCFEADGAQASRRASREDFRARVAHGKVVELLHANHYIFVSNRDDVLREMRAFFGTLASQSSALQ